MTSDDRFDRFGQTPARRQRLEDGIEIDVRGRAFDLLVALPTTATRVPSWFAPPGPQDASMR